MAPLVVCNFILRIENPVGECHPGLEVLTLPDYTLWLKDYDVFELTDNESLMNAIADAARIAAEVRPGTKYLHIELDEANIPLRIPPFLLRTLGEANCSLEVYAEYGEESKNNN